MERASLRETQDTGCKGGPRQGVFVVVKPYQEYRRSISLLALQKGRENKKSRERGGERERERRKLVPMPVAVSAGVLFDLAKEFIKFCGHG